MSNVDITTLEEQLLDKLTDPKRASQLSPEDLKMEEEARQLLDSQGMEPLHEILKRADAVELRIDELEEIREDVFLQAVCLTLQNKREALRHRAHMMRLKANEFDELADKTGHTEEQVKEYVFRLIHHIGDISRLLKEHAHIQPKQIKP